MKIKEETIKKWYIFLIILVVIFIIMIRYSNEEFPFNYFNLDDSDQKILYNFFSSYEEFEEYANNRTNKIIISTNGGRINSAD